MQLRQFAGTPVGASANSEDWDRACSLRNFKRRSIGRLVDWGRRRWRSISIGACLPCELSRRMVQSVQRGNSGMERNTWPAGSDGRQIHEICLSSSGSQRRIRSLHSNVVGIARTHRQRHHTRRLDTCPREPTARVSSSWKGDSASASQDRGMHVAPINVTPLYRTPAAISSDDSGRLVKDSSVLHRRLWIGKNENTAKDGNCSSGLLQSSVEVTTSSEVVTTAATSLAFDVLQRIAGSFSWHDLWSATRTCKTWNKALAPLREGMHFLHWGKKFKHGHGVAKNLDKALQSFTKGAIRGCAAAMVDAGLLLWELGRRDEGIKWYKQAAELRHPAGMCNLGLAYLQDFSSPVEAVRWLKLAAQAGHARAQYSLALCLQQGKGIQCNVQDAACWYLQSAEGGSSRGMYNTALCLRSGEGVIRNLFEAKRWMRRAAMAGHGKAMFEHGLTLFAEGEGGPALVFLELATRAGESGATHIRDALLVQLTPRLRAHALACADNFQNGNKVKK